MNKLRQSAIRKDALNEIELREAVNSLNKSGLGKFAIYTKAAAIAVVRTAKETFNKIKNKINEISKKDNQLKLNAGNNESTVKVYEPKCDIKNKYKQNIEIKQYRGEYERVKKCKGIQKNIRCII